MKGLDQKVARKYLRVVKPLQSYFKPDERFGRIYELLLARQHGATNASCGLPARFQIKWAKAWMARLNQIAPAHLKLLKAKQLQTVLAELEHQAVPKRLNSRLSVTFKTQGGGAVTLNLKNKLQFNPLKATLWVKIVERRFVSPHTFRLAAGEQIAIDLSQYTGEIQVLTVKGRVIARSLQTGPRVEPEDEMSQAEDVQPPQVVIREVQVEPQQPLPPDIVPPTFSIIASHDRKYVYFRFELVGGQMYGPLDFQITPAAWKAASTAEFFCAGQLPRFDAVGKYVIRAMPIPPACWIQVWVQGQSVRMYHNIARHRRGALPTIERPELPQIWDLQPSRLPLRTSRPGIREEHIRRRRPMSDDFHNYDWPGQEYIPPAV